MTLFTKWLPVYEGISFVAVRAVLPVRIPVETAEPGPVGVPLKAEPDIRQLN